MLIIYRLLSSQHFSCSGILLPLQVVINLSRLKLGCAIRITFDGMLSVCCELIVMLNVFHFEKKIQLFREIGANADGFLKDHEQRRSNQFLAPLTW